MLLAFHKPHILATGEEVSTISCLPIYSVLRNHKETISIRTHTADACLLMSALCKRKEGHGVQHMRSMPRQEPAFDNIVQFLHETCLWHARRGIAAQAAA